MSCPFPEHHGSGGGGWAGPIAAVLVAMIAFALLGSVMHTVMLVLFGVAGVVLAAGAGIVLFYWHRFIRHHLGTGPSPVMVGRRAARSLPQTRPAIEDQGGQHVHLHLQGMSVDEAAAVIRRAQGQ